MRLAFLLFAATTAVSAVDDATRAALVSGVSSPVSYSGAPGTVALFGAAATSLMQDTTGATLAAATLYTDTAGPVCAFSHPNMISDPALGSFGLVDNCVAWVGGGGALSCVLHGSARTSAAVTAYTAAGCTVVASNNAFDVLGSVDLVVLYSENLAETGANETDRREKLAAFLAAGGGLVTSGLGWSFVGYQNPDLRQHPGNRLLASCGVAFNDGLASMGSGGVVLSNAEYDARTHNLYYALEAIPSSGGNATLFEFAAAQLAKIDAAVEDGIENVVLSSLLAQASSAFSSTCSSFTWLVSSSNKVLKTETLKRACMEFALALPASTSGVNWAAEAAIFPGDVPSASMRTTTVNVLRNRTHWFSTGLFVAADSTLVVTIPESAIGYKLSLQVGCHKDVLSAADDWQRWRRITSAAALVKSSTTLKVRFGGLVYVSVGAQEAGSIVAVTLQGKLVDSPLYKHGTTSIAEWNAALASTLSPWGEIEAKEVVMTFQVSELAKVASVPEVAEYWESVIECIYRYRAISPYTHKQRYVSDVQISAGWMHSGLPIMMYLSVQDETLMTTASWSHWGQYHEMGHNVQNWMWTFVGTTEVTVNLFTMYCEKEITGNWSWINLENEHAKAEQYKIAPNFDTWKSDPFLALMMYVDLADMYSWDLFHQLFIEYDNLPEAERPATDDEERDQWMMRISRRVGRSMCSFFGMWDVPVSQAACDSVAYLPEWNASVPSVESSSSEEECTPTTCAALDKNCGSWSDGCHTMLDCGSCTAPFYCISGTCVCLPSTTCESQGLECGQATDDCGTSLFCGNCTENSTVCQENMCVISNCTPTTCAALGKNCGSWSDGCFEMLNCGSCIAPNVCNNGRCVDNSNPTTQSSSNGGGGGGGGGGLSTTTIIIIAGSAGGAVLLGAIIALVIVGVRHHNKKQRKYKPEPNEPSELDTELRVPDYLQRESAATPATPPRPAPHGRAPPPVPPRF